MIKIIACDLDETLLDHRKEISKANIDAIQRAKDEYGVRFVVATGRGYTSIDSILKPLGLYQKENEYIISGNGAIICEAKNFRKLAFHGLDYEKACELFAYGYDKDVCMQVFTDQDVYAFHLNEDEQTVLFQFKPDSIICEETNLDFLKGKTIMKILFQNTDMDYLHALAQEMEPLTKDMCSVSFSSGRYLEFNAFGIDKGRGLRELCEYLNIAIEDTMAIGDNYNDLEMIKTAGIGVGVANSADVLKAACDYICTSDHNHSAVAEAIHRFIFQEEFYEGK